MIWSLVKIFLFIGLIAALTFGSAYIIDAGGEVRVAIGTVEFSLSPLAGLIAAALVLLTAWLGLRLLALLVAIFRFFNGDETAISRYFDRNRERKGFQALADGMMALASGEGRLAMAKAARAEKYLQKPELTLLLSAQAAEITGDGAKAQEIYKKLLGDERTRFVGVHGIMKQKLAIGDTDTALKLAEKAFALRPRHEKTLDVLFTLQSEKADWSGARKTLEAKLKTKSLPKDVHTRRNAVLALAEAKEAIASGDIESGSKAAFLANRLSPDLIPAAVLAAKMHVLKATPKPAIKLLKKVWAVTPHPDIAAAFADIAPDETAKERQARFQTLLKIQPDHRESKMLGAELALVAEDFPSARKILGDLAEVDPSVRSLTIMAAIERGEGAEEMVVRGWLTKALSAARGPQWMCDSCHHIHGTWSPTCENCARFDTLAWAVPPSIVEGMGATDMLPLLVGPKEGPLKTPPPPEPVIPPSQPAAIVSSTTSPHYLNENDPSEDLDGIIGDPPVLPKIDRQIS